MADNAASFEFSTNLGQVADEIDKYLSQIESRLSDSKGFSGSTSGLFGDLSGSFSEISSRYATLVKEIGEETQSAIKQGLNPQAFAPQVQQLAARMREELTQAVQGASKSFTFNDSSLNLKGLVSQLNEMSEALVRTQAKFQTGQIRSTASSARPDLTPRGITDEFVGNTSSYSKSLGLSTAAINSLTKDATEANSQFVELTKALAAAKGALGPELLSALQQGAEGRNALAGRVTSTSGGFVVDNPEVAKPQVFTDAGTQLTTVSNGYVAAVREAQDAASDLARALSESADATATETTASLDSNEQVVVARERLAAAIDKQAVQTEEYGRTGSTGLATDGAGNLRTGFDRSLGNAFAGGFFGRGFDSNQEFKPREALSNLAGTAGVLARYGSEGQILYGGEGLLKDSFKDYESYQSAMVNLNQALKSTGTSQANVNALIQAGAGVNVSSSDAINAGAEALKAYGDYATNSAAATQIMTESIQQAGIAAVNTGLSLQDAQKYLQGATFGFNSGPGGQAQINDAVTNASLNFGGDQGQILEGVSDSAADAAEAGISPEELANMIALIQRDDPSITGSSVGSEIQKLITRGQNGTFLQALSQAGVQNSGNLSTELPALSKYFNNLGGEQQQGFITDLGGARAIGALLPLLRDGGQLVDANNKSFEDGGAASREYAAQMATVGAQLRQVGTQLKDLATNVGKSGIFLPLAAGIEVLKPGLELINELIEAVDKLDSALSHIPVIGGITGHASQLAIGGAELYYGAKALNSPVGRKIFGRGPKTDDLGYDKDLGYGEPYSADSSAASTAAAASTAEQTAEITAQTEALGRETEAMAAWIDMQEEMTAAAAADDAVRIKSVEEITAQTEALIAQTEALEANAAVAGADGAAQGTGGLARLAGGLASAFPSIGILGSGLKGALGIGGEAAEAGGLVSAAKGIFSYEGLGATPLALGAVGVGGAVAAYDANSHARNYDDALNAAQSQFGVRGNDVSDLQSSAESAGRAAQNALNQTHGVFGALTTGFTKLFGGQTAAEAATTLHGDANLATYEQNQLNTAESNDASTGTAGGLAASIDLSGTAENISDSLSNLTNQGYDANQVLDGLVSNLQGMAKAGKEASDGLATVQQGQLNTVAQKAADASTNVLRSDYDNFGTSGNNNGGSNAETALGKVNFNTLNSAINTASQQFLQQNGLQNGGQLTEQQTIAFRSAQQAAINKSLAAQGLTPDEVKALSGDVLAAAGSGRDNLFGNGSQGLNLTPTQVASVVNNANTLAGQAGQNTSTSVSLSGGSGELAGAQQQLKYLQDLKATLSKNPGTKPAQLQQLQDDINTAQLNLQNATLDDLQASAALAESVVSPFDPTGEINQQLSDLQKQLSVTTDKDKREQIQASINQAKNQLTQQQFTNQQSSIGVNVEDYVGGKAVENDPRNALVALEQAQAGYQFIKSHGGSGADLTDAQTKLFQAQLAYAQAQVQDANDARDGSVAVGDKVGEAYAQYADLLNTASTQTGGAQLKTLQQAATQYLAYVQAQITQNAAIANEGLNNQDTVQLARHQVGTDTANLNALEEYSPADLTDIAQLREQRNNDILAERQAQNTRRDDRQLAFTEPEDTTGQAREKVDAAQRSLKVDTVGSDQYYQDLAALNAAKLAYAQAEAEKADAIQTSTIDPRNVIAEAKAGIDAAKRALDADEQGTTQYYQDLAALHQAQLTLAQDEAALAEATDIANADPRSALSQALAKVEADRKALSVDKPGTAQYQQDRGQLKQDQFTVRQDQVGTANAKIEANVVQGDDVSQAVADVQTAQNNLGLYKKGTEEYYQALQQLRQAQYQEAQAELALSQAEIGSSVAPGNAVSAAQAQVEEAEAALNTYKQGTEKYYEALTQLNQAKYDLAQAEIQHNEALALLAGDVTDPVSQAVAQLQAAQAQLATDQANGTGDTAQDEVAVLQDQYAVQKAAFDEQNQIEQNLYNLHQISGAQYLQYLENEQATLKAQLAGTQAGSQGYYQTLSELQEVQQDILSANQQLTGQFNVGSGVNIAGAVYQERALAGAAGIDISAGASAEAFGAGSNPAQQTMQPLTDALNAVAQPAANAATYITSVAAALGLLTGSSAASAQAASSTTNNSLTINGATTAEVRDFVTQLVGGTAISARAPIALRKVG